jgi:hypothetical protein
MIITYGEEDFASFFQIADKRFVQISIAVGTYAIGFYPLDYYP